MFGQAVLIVFALAGVHGEYAQLQFLKPNVNRGEWSPFPSQFLYLPPFLLFCLLKGGVPHSSISFGNLYVYALLEPKRILKLFFSSEAEGHIPDRNAEYRLADSRRVFRRGAHIHALQGLPFSSQLHHPGSTDPS